MKGRRSTSKSLLSQAVSDSCLQYQDTPVLQQGKVSTDVDADENKVRVVDADRVGVGFSTGSETTLWVAATVFF